MRLLLGVLAVVAAGCLSVAMAQEAGTSAPSVLKQSRGGEQRQDAQEPQPQARNPGPTEQPPAPAREGQAEHRNRAEDDPGKEGREARALAAGQGIWRRFVGFVEANDTFVVALGTLVTAAFTAILGGATIALFVATRNLVKGAESTAERQLRAYVGTSRIHFRRFSPVEPTSVAVEIKNFGATPAHDYRTELWLEIQPHPKPSEGAFARHDGPSIATPVSLMPGAESLVICELPYIMSAPVMAGIVAETFALYLCGTIRYRDVFGKEQHTHVRKLARGKRSQTEAPFIDAPEGNQST